MRCIHPENAGVSSSRLPASCTPEGVSENLMKVALILHWFSVNCLEFLSFFYKLQGCGGRGKTFLYLLTTTFTCFRHTDTSQTITVESSPLHMAGKQIRTEKLWYRETIALLLFRKRENYANFL